MISRTFSQTMRWVAAGLLIIQLQSPASSRAQSKPPAGPASDAIIANPLNGVTIVPRYEDVSQDGIAGIRGVALKGPEFLRKESFADLVGNYLGQPLTERGLIQLQKEIRAYCEAHDHMIVDVISPEQTILDNTVQIAVIEGKIGNVEVRSNKWFSAKLVLRDVGLKPGDVVLAHRVNSGLDWANRNGYQALGSFSEPFRDVSLSFSRGQQLGETTTILEVHDRFPFRPLIGVDDSGIAAIGKYRVYAGFNWANVFGWDHRLNYQYITDTDFKKLKEHIASYVVPLPWKHEFTIFGAYADVNPDFSDLTAGNNTQPLVNKGIFYQISGRYAIPLPSIQRYDHEVSAGVDFKHTDSPLLFEGSANGSLIRTNLIDVLQFLLAYTGRLKDNLGRTAVSIQGVYSPGDLTSHNHPEDFNDFSLGTRPDYLYGRIELRRETTLPFGLSWYTRGSGQWSDAKLVATEVFGLGGFDTVRGYDERIVSGDNGWLLVNELRSPKIHLGLLALPDHLQLLGFFDYGAVFNRSPLVGQQTYNEVLAAVGVGFRYEIVDHFFARFDYGFQLNRGYINDQNAASLGDQPNSRAHFGVEVSF